MMAKLVNQNQSSNDELIVNSPLEPYTIPDLTMSEYLSLQILSNPNQIAIVSNLE